MFIYHKVNYKTFNDYIRFRRTYCIKISMKILCHKHFLWQPPPKKTKRISDLKSRLFYN